MSRGCERHISADYGDVTPAVGAIRPEISLFSVAGALEPAADVADAAQKGRGIEGFGAVRRSFANLARPAKARQNQRVVADSPFFNPIRVKIGLEARPSIRRRYWETERGNGT